MRPCGPAAINSAFPPTAVGSTGKPEAIASRMVFDIPSASDGRDETIQPAMMSAEHRPFAGKPGEIGRSRGLPGFVCLPPQRTVADHDQARRLARSSGAWRSAATKARTRSSDP